MSEYNSTVNSYSGGRSPPAYYHLPNVDRPINPRDPLNLWEEVHFQGDVAYQRADTFNAQQQKSVNWDGTDTTNVSRKRSFVADEDSVVQPYKKKALFGVPYMGNLTAPTNIDQEMTKKITVEQYQERRRALKRKRDEMSSSSDVRQVQNNDRTSSSTGCDDGSFEF